MSAESVQDALIAEPAQQLRHVAYVHPDVLPITTDRIALGEMSRTMFAWCALAAYADEITAAIAADDRISDRITDHIIENLTAGTREWNSYYARRRELSDAGADLATIGLSLGADR